MSLEAVAHQAGVDVACIRIIAKWEGCLRKLPTGLYGPYLCPARVATIGIGTTVWPDGRRVTMQDAPIPHERCQELLAYDIGKRYAPAVDRHGIKWAHENQRSACTSFTYNVGTAGFGKSTLCWFLKQQKWDRAAGEFGKWVNGGGRRLQGLVNRRNDERRLFLTPGGGLPRAPAAIDPAAPPPTPTPVAVPRKPWWRRALNRLGF